MGFDEILSMGPAPKRTAALAAWLQGLYPEGADLPVLVGGAAVELYTGGAYVTGDLDFVGAVPPSVKRRLLRAGFRKEGRHWLHEQGQIFLEFPGRSLDDGSKPAILKTGRLEILIIGPEALLVDRIRRLVFWRHRQDGLNAVSLAWAQRRALSPAEVRRLARETEVRKAFEGLWNLVRRSGSKAPKAADIGLWIEENVS